MKEKELLAFYKIAKYYVLRDFNDEFQHVNNLDFNKTTAEQFVAQYFFVVLSAGMKNQVVESMMKKFEEANWDPTVINHEGKRNAIIKGINNYVRWFDELKSIKDERGKIEYLATLPWIGKITKYHLARNIGLDCAKPDRWLVLLANRFEFPTPRSMCEWLAHQFEDKIGVVDVVLWRYCNMHPDEVKKMHQTVLEI